MGSLQSETNFDDPGSKVQSPAMLAHIVLKTTNYEQMVKFWTTFVGGSVTYGNDFVSFITYDEEHHRIAILNVPGTGPKAPLTAGLDHIAFTFPTTFDLLLSYRQRKARGISPIWCVNHGPTSSIYYKDPDRNMIETQVDNFNTVEGANGFMNSKLFAENPIGTDFDPEDWINRIKAGERDENLKRRVESGPRMLPNTAEM